MNKEFVCECSGKLLVQFIGDVFYRCLNCNRRYLKKYKGKSDYYFELM